MKKMSTVQKIVTAALTVLPAAAWIAVRVMADGSDADYVTGVIGFIPVMAALAFDLFTLSYNVFYTFNNVSGVDMLHMALLVISAIQSLFLLPLATDFTLCGVGAADRFFLSGWLIDRVGPQIVFLFSIPVAVLIVLVWLFILGKRARKIRF